MSLIASAAKSVAGKYHLKHYTEKLKGLRVSSETGKVNGAELKKILNSAKSKLDPKSYSELIKFNKANKPRKGRVYREGSITRDYKGSSDKQLTFDPRSDGVPSDGRPLSVASEVRKDVSDKQLYKVSLQKGYSSAGDKVRAAERALHGSRYGKSKRPIGEVIEHLKSKILLIKRERKLSDAKGWKSKRGDSEIENLRKNLATLKTMKSRGTKYLGKSNA